MNYESLFYTVNKDFILDNVEFCLTPREKAQGMRGRGVHFDTFLDCLVTYNLLGKIDHKGSEVKFIPGCFEEEEVTYWVVTDKIMEIAGINKEDMRNAALDNLLKTEYEIKSTSEICKEAGIIYPDDGLRILRKRNGAPQGTNVLLREDVLKKLAEEIGDFYAWTISFDGVMTIPKNRVEMKFLKILARLTDDIFGEQKILNHTIYKFEDGELGILTELDNIKVYLI